MGFVGRLGTLSKHSFLAFLPGGGTVVYGLYKYVPL